MTHIVVIIPTIDGREASFERTCAGYLETAGDHELELLPRRGFPTCGSAWQDAMEELERRAADSRTAPCDYVHLSADDLVPEAGWVDVAVETVRRGNVPAPVILNPDGRVCSAGHDPGVETITTRDWEPTPVSVVPIFSWQMWREIAPMQKWHYFTDDYFSFRCAWAGYPVVVRQALRFVHHHENVGRGAGLTEGGRMQVDRVAFLSYLQSLQVPPRADANAPARTAA